MQSIEVMNQEIDSRDPLSRLNRQSLIYLLQANGIIGWNEEMSKEDLIKIATIGDNPSKLYRQFVRDNRMYATYMNVDYYLGANGNVVVNRPVKDIEKSMKEEKEDGRVMRGRPPLKTGKMSQEEEIG